MKVRDLLQLDGSTIIDWMDDDGVYDAVRVSPGIVLTQSQFQSWLLIRHTQGAEAAEAYALANGTATT